MYLELWFKIGLEVLHLEVVLGAGSRKQTCRSYWTATFCKLRNSYGSGFMVVKMEKICAKSAVN